MKKTIIGFLLCCVTVFAAEPDAKRPALSDAVRADIKLMWETVPLHGEPGKKVSSARATEAAHRVFMTIQLVGMTQQEVVKLLGDPKTSSDSIYNFPFYPAAKGDLTYRFDTGQAGWQFDIAFDARNRVTKVTPRGIE